MSTNDINCVICQGEENGELINVHQYDSNHCFHKNCFAAWDLTCKNNNHNTTCPICREVIDQSILNTVQSDEQETQIIRQRYNNVLDTLLVDIINNTIQFVMTHPRTSAFLLATGSLLYRQLSQGMKEEEERKEEKKKKDIHCCKMSSYVIGLSIIGFSIIKYFI